MRVIYYQRNGKTSEKEHNRENPDGDEEIRENTVSTPDTPIYKKGNI